MPRIWSPFLDHDPREQWRNDHSDPEEEPKGIYETVRECLNEGMTAAEIVAWRLEETYWSKEEVINVIEEIEED